MEQSAFNQKYINCDSNNKKTAVAHSDLIGATPRHQKQQPDYLLPTLAPDTVNIRDLQLLRNRGRDLYRYNSFIRKAIRSNAANAIFTGIKPLFIDEKTGNKNMTLQRLHRRWVEKSDHVGDLNLYLQQAKIIQALGHTGEIFVIPRPGLAGSPVDLSLQLIEADLIPLWLNKKLTTGEIKQGIEYDDTGRKVAVWVLPAHPGDHTRNVFNNTAKRIPFELILHIFDPDRVGESRGAPNITSSISKSRDMQKVEDATIEHHQQQNAITGFITKPGAEGLGVDNFFGDETVPTKNYGSGLSATVGSNEVGHNSALQIGTFKQLSTGEAVEFANLADAGRTYKDFVSLNQHAIAAGADSTYSKTTGDLTQTSFSSMREGGQEYQRGISQNYQMLTIQQFCRRVGEWFLTAAVLKGAININEAQNIFIDWIPPGFPHANPLQGAEADTRNTRSGFTSRSRVAMERTGIDAATLDEEQKRDNESADSAGVIYDSDPRKTSRAGQAVEHELAQAAVND